jgi:hypothetical protein
MVELEVTLARVASLLVESAEAFSGLAGRFAVNLAIRAPELVSGPVGGGAIGAGLALASGARDPIDIAMSAGLGAGEGAVGRRAGVTEKVDPVPAISVDDVLTTLPEGRSPDVWTVWKIHIR